MRYLVRAKVKPERAAGLLAAIQTDTLGEGSVAEGEYLRNMHEARLYPDGTARWVETCYCATPLEEERPYWEEFFELAKVQDAHARRNCRDENGSEPWACGSRDCTRKLEQRLKKTGVAFLPELAKKRECDGRLGASSLGETRPRNGGFGHVTDYAGGKVYRTGATGPRDGRTVGPANRR